MSGSSFEDRLIASLHSMAEEVTAPATRSVRAAVGRHKARLRRRRIRRTVSSVSLAVAVAIASGTLWWGASSDTDLRMGQRATDATERQPLLDAVGLPAFTVDDPAFEPVVAEEHEDESDGTCDGAQVSPCPWDAVDPSGWLLQVFRRSDHLAAPTVFISQPPALGDAPVLLEGGAPVQVGGHDAQVTTANPLVPVVAWWEGGDTIVRVSSWGLTTDELLQFAGGLERRSDGTGFDATILPQGISEARLESLATGDAGRYARFESPDGTTAAFLINEGDEPHYAFSVEELSSIADEIEQVEMLGKAAVLLRHGSPAEPRTWSLAWRHTSSHWVVVQIAAQDRAQVDDVIAAIREIDESAWQDLVDTYGPTP